MSIDLGTGLSVRDINTDPQDLDPIPRNKNGWPLVPDPHNAGQTLTCHRPSGIAKKFLTDDYSIKLWEQRLTLKGAGLRPDLGQMAAALEIKADKDELNELVKQAARAAGRESKANTGTALHRQMEAILKGETIDAAPDLLPDIAEIQMTLDRYGIEAVSEQWVEPFVINTDIPGAGSPDSFVTSTYFGPGNLVLDLKNSDDPFGFSSLLEYAVQLATYAHAGFAWNGNPHYLPWETPDMRTDIGLIIHRAPNGGYDITPIDIAEGYEMLQLAMRVHGARSNMKRFYVEMPEPPADRIIGSVTSISEHLAKREATPSLEAECNGLRRRLESLVEHGCMTGEHINSVWPESCPSLKRPEDHTAETVAAISAIIELWETKSGNYPATNEDVDAMIMRLKVMPQDLKDEATKQAAKLANPVNLMQRRGAYGIMDHQLEALLPIADAMEAAHTARIERLVGAVAAVGTNALHAATDAANIHRDLAAADYTVAQADRLIAMLTYPADPDNAEANLVAHCGSKSEVLKCAKELAVIHELGKPRSTAAVAADPVLTALVLAERQPSATDKVLATFEESEIIE